MVGGKPGEPGKPRFNWKMEVGGKVGCSM